MLNLLPAQYRDFLRVTAGNLMRNFLAGIFKLIIAAALSPQALGILRSIYAFFKILTNLVGLGLDYAAITLASAAIKRGDSEEKERLLRATLVLKILVTLVMVIVSFFVSDLLASSVFGDQSLSFYVRLVFLAAGGKLLWKFLSAYFSIHMQFGRLTFFITTTPIVMLVVALILMFFDKLDLNASILIYLFSPLAAVALWWPTVNRGFIKAPFWQSNVVRKIIGFSGWVYIADGFSSIGENIFPLLLKNPKVSGSLEAGELNAGLYSFGDDLAGEVSILSQSLVMVLLPKAAGKISKDELRQFIKKSYGHLFILIVPLSLLIFAAEPFIRILGMIKHSLLDYLPAAKAFAILYAGSLFSLASIPMESALYAMKKPQIGTVIEIFMVIFVVIGGLVAIPHFGFEGAAVVIFFQRVITFIILLGFGMKKLNEPGEITQ